jgi:undecaprenyl-diphosphatase
MARPVCSGDSSGQTAIFRVGEALLCILVFCLLAWQLRAGGLYAFDNAVTGWVRADIVPGLTRWMILITNLGDLDSIIVLTAIAAIFLFARRCWRDGMGVAAASLGSWLLHLCLKQIFQRPRPDLPHLVPAGGFSFPSGHATVTAALFFTVAMIGCHLAANRTGRVLVRTGAVLVVLLVGISRIYLGVHYPSDVVAGWAVGGFWALAIAVALRLDGGNNYVKPAGCF